MKKIRIVAMLLLLVSILLTGCNEKGDMSKYTYKEYDKSRYEMDRSKLQIGIFDLNGKAIDEMHIKDLSDFGVNLIIHTAGTSTDFLNLCGKYGMYVIQKNVAMPRIIANRNLEDILTEEQYSKKIDEYVSKAYVAGDDLYDEPSSKYFDILSAVVNEYSRKIPGKLPFINLHPMYCPDYKEYLDTATYEEYILRYTQKIDTDYICFDVYPFDNSTVGLYQQYLENIDVVSEACRQSGRDYWVITQAGGNTGITGVTYNQVRWQAYLNLAYGAKAIIHACYTPCWWNERTTPLTSGGEKNKIWYDVSSVNEELNSLSKVYMDYTSTGVTGYIKPIADMRYLDAEAVQVDAQIKRNKEKGLNSNELISFSNIEATDDLIIGCFKNNTSGSEAVMLVNMMNTYYSNMTTTVTFRCNSGKELTAHTNMAETVLQPDQNGVYTLTLDVGQGVFITQAP